MNSDQAPAEKKPSAVRRFFSIVNQFLTVLRKIVSISLNIIFLLLVITLISLFVGSNQEQLQTPTEGALLLTLGTLVDQPTYTSPVAVILEGDVPLESVVRDVIETIDLAANDSDISALVIDTSSMAGGISKIQEIGTAILRFRESGKPVLVSADAYSQNQYLMASFADEIGMHSMGYVGLTGYGSFQLYMRDALDKLKIQFHVFRSGDYKDAVEPFLLDEMSDESRAQRILLLEDIWSHYRQTVLENRSQLDEADFDRYLNQFDEALAEYGGDSATLAADISLIDHIGSRDQIDRIFSKISGVDFSDWEPVNANVYLRSQRQLTDDAPKVGLIVAEGAILDGYQPSGTIGGESLAELIRDARERDIEALVIRVNSPGGSAFASEIIRREIELTRDEGIPVVISMGSLAASGGYWVSMAADKLVATRTTITGSIGVFSIIPTFEQTLEGLGLNSDGVGTTPFSDAFHLDRPMSEEMASVLQSSVDHIYGQFLSIVSENRDISEEDLAPLASGRVWSGAQALERNLVDEIGGLEDAERIAAELAELEQYQVLLIEPELSFAEEFARSLSERVAVAIDGSEFVSSLRPLLNLVPEWSQQISEFNDPRSLYLLCATCSEEI